MTQESMPTETKVVLGDTHFQYPGEEDLIAYSTEAIANDTRHSEMMRLTGEEMIRRSKLESQ